MKSFDVCQNFAFPFLDFSVLQVLRPGACCFMWSLSKDQFQGLLQSCGSKNVVLFPFGNVKVVSAVFCLVKI